MMKGVLLERAFQVRLFVGMTRRPCMRSEQVHIVTCTCLHLLLCPRANDVNCSLVALSPLGVWAYSVVLPLVQLSPHGALFPFL